MVNDMVNHAVYHGFGSAAAAGVTKNYDIKLTGLKHFQIP
jgi:hypothetical protein